MRRTRFMSVLFLVLSASYFAMPQFRQAIYIPYLLRAIDKGDSAFLRLPGLMNFKASAEAQHDARMLAFLSLREPDLNQATRLADLACSADKQYGWVYFGLFGRPNVQKSTDGLAFARKVQAFDPDNALGYLMEAEYIRANSFGSGGWMPHTEAGFKARMAYTDWLAAMDKAFSASKYDSYHVARFDLERQILVQHHVDNPVRVALMLASYPIPNLLNIREYASLRADYLAKSAADAGKSQEALAHYWAVAHFGERMQLGADTIIEQLIAAAVREIAYKPLIALLQKTGDVNSAQAVQYASDFLQRRTDFFRGKDILTQSATYTWNAILVNVFLGLTLVFALLTVASILYVNVKRWWGAHKGSLYGGITIAENYFPILLFIFSTGLYISYYPYARNFEHYMTATGYMHDLESVFYNTISLPMVMPRFLQLSVGNPFVPYLWYALGAVAIVVAAQFLVPEPKLAEKLQGKSATGV